MSKITTEKYDPVRIERLRHYLESCIEKGKPKFYEIFVDNLKAVDKTDDTTCFDEYKMYVDDNTQMVKILVYTSTENCPRNDKFIFSLRNPKEEKKQEQLNGLEIQNRIDTAIQLERDRNQVLQLQKELDDTKVKLRESEEYADLLGENLKTVQEEFEQFKRKRIGMAEMNTGKLVGFFTDYLIKSHPVIAKKLPIVSTLSGLLLDENSSPDQLNGVGTPPAQEMHAAATFSKKTEAPDSSPIDPATQSKLDFLGQMEEVFTEEQMEQVIKIIEGLMVHPDQIATFHSFFYAAPSK